jgi:hypothetical protein
MPSEVLNRDEQQVFINGSEVRGVQTVGFQYRVNSAPVRFIGMQQVREVPSSPQVGTVSISHLLISDDIFLQFTGEQAITGYILKGKNNATDNIGFNSGYLTNYRVSCAVGQIPEIEASIDVFGNVARIPREQDLSGFDKISTGITPGLKIAAPGSLTLNVDGFDTNRVQSFNIQITAPRNPIYILGDRNPKSIENGGPLEISCSFTISAKDFNPYALRSYPASPLQSNVQATFKDLTNDSGILTYSFPKLTLQSQSYSVDVDNHAEVNLVYNGYLLTPHRSIRRLYPRQEGAALIKQTTFRGQSGQALIQGNQIYRNAQGKSCIARLSKQGLVAHWKMDSTGVNGVIADSHVYNNQPRFIDMSPPIAFDVGILGNAIIGDGRVVALDENAGSNFIFNGGTTEPFTFAVWFKSPGVGALGRYLFHKYSDLNPFYPVLIDMTLGANLRCYFNVRDTMGLVSASASSNNLWVANQWNLVIGWYDNTGQRVHIKLNNVLGQSSSTANIEPATQTGTFYFWYFPRYTPYSYRDALDEMAVWRRTLSDKEHDLLWNNGLGFDFSKYLP